ncbi:PadR family transcriptional regulator [Microbacterium sp. UFMG61]|uniref:PadR family transcriptional regulator n=1 Tax=Microbacterium sp. UFMG61 TaxID=2745935 RepID=UPI00188EFCC3|nr:PadR family transcriptional regulator [Microbacterium sp. UFMG61]
MQLRHAVLGLLDIAPQSGYDLGRAFDGSVAHFWNADQSQIYRTLDRLEADGAIETETIPQQGKPDRRVHSLTDGGRAELAEWLGTPLEVLKPKEPFLARLFFAAPLGVEGVLQLLDEREAAVRAALDQLRALPAASGDLGAVLRAATLDAGIRQGEAELAWLRATRASVSDLEGS